MAELWLPSLITGVVASGVTYFVFRRKFSGRIDVSEAKELWVAQERYIHKLLRRIRDHEIQDYERRIEAHYLRNELTTFHFAVAGNVPEDLKEKLREMAETHIEELKKALAEKRAAPLNGNGG